MNKQEFLAALEQRLSVLSDADRKRSLLYFEEIIADRMEEGLSEEEVIAQMESPDEIAVGIINETVAEGQRVYQEPEKKKLGGCPLWLAILLAVLASPIWLPILLSVASVVVSLYFSVWIIIACMYAVAAALFFGGIVGVVAALISAAAEPVYAWLFTGGISLFCIGLGILLVFPTVILTRWYAKGTVFCCRKIANLRKGGNR